MAQLDATALAEEIKAGRISPREAITDSISRIEATQSLNAVVHERFDQALREVEQGLPMGPLTGVPFLVKNLATQVAGLPLTHGSKLFEGNVSTVDSDLVRLYRRAGLVILGSTNSPELGRNTATEPLLYGATRNPWNTRFSTAGSSGGSAAAVAAGLVPVAHATDGGGSIRLPAAMCGLVGLKPSRGRMPGWPNPSGASAPLGVAHVVSRTVRDSALLLDVGAQRRRGDPLSGGPHDFVAAASHPVQPLRIGWSTTAPDGGKTDPEVAEAVERAAQLFEDLGHQVTEARLQVDVDMMNHAFVALMRADLIDVVDRRLAELGRELRDDDLEPYTRALYDRPTELADYYQAQRELVEVGWQAGAYFNDYDLWLSPTVGARVPELGVVDTTDLAAVRYWAPKISRFTSLFNLTGQPAISLPFGQDDNGLPIGIQLVADTGEEARLLAIAAQMEEAHPWQVNRYPSEFPITGIK